MVYSNTEADEDAISSSLADSRNKRVPGRCGGATQLTRLSFWVMTPGTAVVLNMHVFHSASRFVATMVMIVPPAVGAI
jgi:hypothetical protein